MKSDLDRFDGLVTDITIAMMTTRRRDGHLRARALANQKRAPGADLWFVMSSDSDELDDVRHDPHVNLSYYDVGSRQWVSVSGTATLSRDPARIRDLYQPGWRAWFPEEGDTRHGTPDDPRIVLIGVTVHVAEFLEVNRPRPVLFLELIRGWVRGTDADVGEGHDPHPHPRTH